MLNISQAVAVVGAGSLFIPEIGQKISLEAKITSVAFALVLYILAMYIGRSIKNE